MADCAGAAESVTSSVKSKLPPVVGVPVMFTEAVFVVVALKSRPGGRLPEETLQLKGPIPPVASMGAE